MSGSLSGKTMSKVYAARHALGLTTDGQLFSWGTNLYGKYKRIPKLTLKGQLGTGDTTYRGTPFFVNTGVLAGKTVADFAIGISHSLVLATDGTLCAFGRNNAGQLGNSSVATSSVPITVDTSGVLSGKTVVAITVLQSTSLVQTSDGMLFSFGDNTGGRLGNSNSAMSMSSVPVAVNMTSMPAGTLATSMTGTSSGFYVLMNSVLYTWGVSNGYAMLDGLNSNAVTYQPTPRDTSSMGTLVKVFMSSQSTSIGNMALSADGKIWSFGQIAQFGFPADGRLRAVSEPIYPPVAANNTMFVGKSISQISCDNTRCLAIRNDGMLLTWGNVAEYGSANISIKVSPVSPNTASLTDVNFVSVAAGSSYSLALTSNNTVYAWGYNFDNRITSNTAADQYLPVLIDTSSLGGKTITQIVANQYSGILTSTGEVYMWGTNTGGCLGDGTTMNRAAPTKTQGLGGVTIKKIAVNEVSLGLATNGQLYSWGPTTRSLLGTSAAVSDRLTPALINMTGALLGKQIADVDIGLFAAIVATTDGLAYVWGQNYPLAAPGLLGINSASAVLYKDPVPVYTGGALSNAFVTQVSVGISNMMVLTSAGNIYVWGTGSYYPGIGSSNLVAPTLINMGLFIGNVTSIKRSTSAVVITDDGTRRRLYGWGTNPNLELSLSGPQVTPTLISSIPIPSGANVSVSLASTWMNVLVTPATVSSTTIAPTTTVAPTTTATPTPSLTTSIAPTTTSAPTTVAPTSTSTPTTTVAPTTTSTIAPTTTAAPTTIAPTTTTVSPTTTSAPTTSSPTTTASPSTTTPTTTSTPTTTTPTTSLAPTTNAPNTTVSPTTTAAPGPAPTPAPTSAPTPGPAAPTTTTPTTASPGTSTSGPTTSTPTATPGTTTPSSNSTSAAPGTTGSPATSSAPATTAGPATTPKPSLSSATNLIYSATLTCLIFFMF